MTDAFVLDASIAIAWFFPDREPERAYADAVLAFVETENPLLVVPDLFHVEVAQFLMLRRRTRSARFGEKKLNAALARLDALRIETRLLTQSYRDIVQWAGRYHVQAKDAPYFVVARQRGLPLATNDSGLMRACEQHGVERLRV